MSNILDKIGFLTTVKNKFYFTEQKYLAKQILNYSNNYDFYEDNLFLIYYTKKDEKFIPFIKNTIKNYYPKLLKDFEIKEIEKIKIIIYPTLDELKKATGLKDNIENPVGIYYGGVINLLSFDNFIFEEKFLGNEENIINGIIIHEISHFIFDKKTKGNFEVWFAEGVALFYENKYTNQSIEKNLNYQVSNIDFYDLTNNFKNLDSDLAYKKAFQVIQDYVTHEGEEKLQEIIFDLGK